MLPSARGGGAGTGSNSTEGHIGYLYFSSAQADRGNKDWLKSSASTQMYQLKITFVVIRM